MAMPRAPRLGDRLHITPREHSVCWIGDVVDRPTDDVRLVHVVYPAHVEGRDRISPEPQQLFIAVAAVTHPVEGDTGTSWHLPADCPWDR